ncbi:hypothetical protein JVU11DRAFT_9343 [Chiua virens]|nr:hypothetical protein JVU11DRAFT_9343 [Chiua virens]
MALEKEYVLVVLDPCRLREEEQVRQHMPRHWVLTSLPRLEGKELLTIRGTRGFVHEARVTDLPNDLENGHIPIYIDELLLIWHWIKQDPKASISPVFMQFDVFQDTIQAESGRKWFTTFKAIFGGLDLTSDPIDFAPHMSEADFPQHLLALQKLEEKVVLWPPVHEMLRLKERKTIKLLDRIARFKTDTPRPSTRFELTLPLPCPAKYMMKREGRASWHVQPGIHRTWNNKRAANLLSLTDSPWFMQEIIHDCTAVGRWRCIVIGGDIYRIILDRGSQGCTLREHGRTLEDMSRVEARSEIMRIRGGSIQEIQAADQVLFLFSASPWRTKKRHPSTQTTPTTSPPPPLNTHTGMAALVAPNNPPLLPVAPPNAGVAKRYRPAPGKIFQWRVSSQALILSSISFISVQETHRRAALHLPLLEAILPPRQHAQTVHADKQDQNERMMRELTSLHASSGRGQQDRPGQSVLQDTSIHHPDQVREEDINPPSISMHQRPGTSTGYEVGDAWNTDVDRGNPRPLNNHSFRDSSQSFRVPPAASNSSSFYGQQQSQSFLSFTNPLNLSVASRDGRPGPSHSRPPTAGGPDSLARTLPPLAAVVSATLPTSSTQQFPAPPQSAQHVLPLPGAAALRRPSTANRPGTAPASYYASKPAYAGGPGLVHQSELSLPVYGRATDLAGTAAAYQHNPFEADPPSSSTGAYDSPFSFHPPTLAESATVYTGSIEPSSGNPRKRPFSGFDGHVNDNTNIRNTLTSVAEGRQCKTRKQPSQPTHATSSDAQVDSHASAASQSPRGTPSPL